MKDNRSRLQKSSNITKNTKLMQWCIVNTENEFQFNNSKYLIGNNVEEYRVYNKAGEVEDYTNESYMDKILGTINLDGTVLFYNQNYDLVENVCLIVETKFN